MRHARASPGRSLSCIATGPPAAQVVGPITAESPRPTAALRRPVDGFFERKAIKGQKAKPPYAIAMKDGSRSGSADCGKTGKT